MLLEILIFVFIFIFHSGVQGTHIIYQMEVCCLVIIFCYHYLSYYFVKSFQPYIFSFSIFLWDSKAVSMFENDERFKAVERSRDREDLFESYIVELERKVGIIYLFMHVH